MINKFNNDRFKICNLIKSKISKLKDKELLGEDLIVQGVQFSRWLVAYLTGGDFNIEQLSFVKVNINTNNNISHSKINNVGHSFKNNFHQYECKFSIDLDNINITKSILEEFIDVDTSYNYLQVAYSPSKNMLFFSSEFIKFLKTSTIEIPKKDYSFDNFISNQKIVHDFKTLKYDKEKDFMRVSLLLLGRDDWNRADKNFYLNIYDKFSYTDLSTFTINRLYISKPNKENLKYLEDNSYFEIQNDQLAINYSNKSHPLISKSRFYKMSKLAQQFILRNTNFFIEGSPEAQNKKSVLAFSNLIYIGNRKEYLSKDLINNLIKKDFNEEKLLKLSQFMKEHSALAKVNSHLIKQGWSIQNLIDFINRLSTERLSIIGFIENYPDLELPKPKNTIEVVESVKKLVDEFWTKRRKGERILVTPLNLDGFPMKDSFKELTTTVDLELEGEEMIHCVGGYSDSINEKHRIFNITIDNKKSTAELIRVRGLWTVKQHRGIQNSEPSDKNKNALKDLCEWTRIENRKKVKTKQTSDDTNFYEVANTTYTFNIQKVQSRMRESFNLEQFLDRSYYSSTTLSECIDELTIIPSGSLPPYLSFIKQSLDDLQRFIIQVKKSQFKDREKYKDLGFVWNPVKKIWWTANTMEEYQNTLGQLELTVHYNQSKFAQELINDLKEYSNDGKRLSRKQRNLIEELF
jgi:hypothetical protein